VGAEAKTIFPAPGSVKDPKSFCLAELYHKSTYESGRTGNGL
jgi:hypothetical protein